MDKLFNSDFENSLRLIILLDLYDMPQTMDMLYAVDFISVYGKTCGVTEANLNGDNEYQFSEFVSRRESVKAALKKLVLNGTAQAVIYHNGIGYIITPEGEELSQSLESEYAKEYRKNAQAAITAIANLSERTIINFINRLSTEADKERDKNE